MTTTVSLMGQENVQAEISDTVADTRVAAQMEAAKTRASLLKAATLAEPASEESISNIGDRKLIMRKVAPMPILKAPVALETDQLQTAFSAEQLLRFQEAQVLEHVYLRLSATVYGSYYTELTLSLEDARFTVWTNQDYSYLPFLGDFQTDTRSYTYTGFNFRIDREKEFKRAAAAREHGFEYHSQWKEPAVRFSSSEPEYILVTEDGREVPEETYRQLDDLMSYYLEHFDALKLAHDNAAKLQAAQERYDAANPKEPQDIILNYSRVSESSQ
jgi:hypothetical protein